MSLLSVFVRSEAGRVSCGARVAGCDDWKSRGIFGRAGLGASVCYKVGCIQWRLQFERLRYCAGSDRFLALILFVRVVHPSTWLVRHKFCQLPVLFVVRVASEWL